MGLKINGSTSGSIEIDVPAVAGTDTSITIPAKNGGTFIVEESTGNIDLGPLDINGSASDDSVVIDGSGRLLIGGTTARSNFDNYSTSAVLQIEGATSDQDAGISVISNANSQYYPSRLRLVKSRGTSLGSNTIVQSNDFLGVLSFQGSDGGEFVEAAAILCEVDNTPGANDMPGRLSFRTTADGAAGPTERMRIRSNSDISWHNAQDIYPATDNVVRLGSGSFRYASVYAANGTIQTSDERQKTEVADSALGTEFVKALRPVSYKWIEGGKRDSGERDEDNNFIYEAVPGRRTHWGFIAQEVKQAVDDAGVDFGGWVLTDKDDPESEQALRYDQFIAPLTKALQEALAKIETLETANASLEARLTALEGGAS